MCRPCIVVTYPIHDWEGNRTGKTAAATWKKHPVRKDSLDRAEAYAALTEGNVLVFASIADVDLAHCRSLR